MPSPLTNYRVFIASPGGLEKEREAFRDVISEYDQADGIPRGAYFCPVGWEFTLRGVGRAQEKINEEVRKCDYFVLLLWDRWGSPTGSEKKYSSGTEEEYTVALECYHNINKPMREIVVFFKTIEPRHLSDPGPQLKKVLDFKRSLEASKAVFFDTFDDLDAFKDKLRRYLAEWVRAHETGTKVKVQPRRITKEADIPEDNDYLRTLEDRLKHKDKEIAVGDLKEVQRLLNEGKLTDAEAKLVQAVVAGDSFANLRAYGQFLLKDRRLTDAETIYNRMRKKATEQGDNFWIGFSLTKLGLIFQIRKQFPQAEELLNEALRLKEKLYDKAGIAFVAACLASLYKKFGKLPQAEESLKISLAMNEALNEKLLAAQTAFQLAVLADRQKKPSQAHSYAEKAIGYYGDMKKEKSMKQVQRWLDGKKL